MISYYIYKGPRPLRTENKDPDFRGHFHVLHNMYPEPDAPAIDVSKIPRYFTVL